MEETALLAWCAVRRDDEVRPVFCIGNPLGRRSLPDRASRSTGAELQDRSEPEWWGRSAADAFGHLWWHGDVGEEQLADPIGIGETDLRETG